MSVNRDGEMKFVQSPIQYMSMGLGSFHAATMPSYESDSDSKLNR